MRKLLLAAAVVSLSVACHNRNEDEVGAAPDAGTADTAATAHVIDSTRTGPPGVSGRPGNATVTTDSVGVDSTVTNQGDAGAPDTAAMSSPTSTPQDTLGPRDTEADGATAHDSTMMHHDSTMMDTTTSR